MLGTDGSIFALGDCTASSYAPTAQVASQQGAYLARVFAQLAKRDALVEQLKAVTTTTTGQVKVATTNAKASTAHDKEKDPESSLKKQIERAEKLLRPFHYSHQGSLAYIGNEKAIADLVVFNQKVCVFLFLWGGWGGWMDGFSAGAVSPV